MIILSTNQLNKSFGIETILEDITFSVQDGERVGIIGINGSGKTTLFKILAGLEPYDSGNIFRSKTCEIGYLEQNMGFDSDKTVLEEVAEVFSDVFELEEELRSLERQIAEESRIINEGNDSTGELSDELHVLMEKYSAKLELFNDINGYGAKSEAKGILKGLGFKDDELDKPISVLSGGEKTRVLLSKILLRRPNLLLLDEPTNHLDSDAIEWLELYLKQYKGTVIIISHDRYFLDQIVGRIFEISNKKLKTYNGNYTEYLKLSRIEREIELKRYENQQEEIKRQEESIERLKAYGREKHLKRARSKEKQLAKVERIDRPESVKRASGFRFKTHSQSGRDVLEVKDFEKSYDVKLFDGISFSIRRGEKVALIGANGTGKSTIFKIITGEIEGDGGEVKFGTNVEYSYFHQEQRSLDLNNTIIDEVWDEYPDLTQTTIRTILGAFLFYNEDVFKKISDLSGGERARVAILKLILSNSNLLLLDEPTNHLDISSKDVLEEALINYDGTILAISHDRYFLNTVVDRILVLEDGKITEYLGNYDYYIEKKRAKSDRRDALRLEDEGKTKTQIKEEKRREKELRLEQTRQKNKIKDLEIEIEQTEKTIHALEVMLCQEEVYSDPDKIKEINIEKKDLEDKLEKLYSKWENMLSEE